MSKDNAEWWALHAELGVGVAYADVVAVDLGVHLVVGVLRLCRFSWRLLNAEV